MFVYWFLERGFVACFLLPKKVKFPLAEKYKKESQSLT